MVENKEKLVCKYSRDTGNKYCVGSELCGETTQFILSALQSGTSKGTQDAIEKLKNIKDCNEG